MICIDATIGFEVASYQVMETQGAQNVCVVISGLPPGGAESDIAVTLAAIPSLKAGNVTLLCIVFWLQHCLIIMSFQFHRVGL